MAGISFGGLASGIDTQSVIDQLIAVDRQPEARLKLRQSALQARQSALTDIGSRLRSLLLAAKDLGSVTTWLDTQSVDVSDATKLSATRLSGAAPGGHEIAVTKLARAEQRTYAFTAGSSGTLNIGAAHVDVTAADTGQTLADKVNAAPDSPVYAVYVKDPAGDTAKDRLVFTRRDTGTFAQGDMTVAPAANWAGGDWTATETYAVGVNAEFSVDGGLAQQSRSNVVTSAVPGLQLTLKATGTSNVTVAPPGPNNDAVKAKVQAFVDQYNSTIDFISDKVEEKKVPKATTDADARKGALFGDTQLSGLVTTLRHLVSEKTGISGSAQSFADLGVSTGAATAGATNADAVAGKLTLDATKLTNALQSNRIDVRAFLADTTKGLSGKLTKLLDPVAKAATGLIDVRAKQARDDSSQIDDRIATIEDRVTQTSDRLKTQFAAMEQALAQSQSQASWLAAQLG